MMNKHSSALNVPTLYDQLKKTAQRDQSDQRAQSAQRAQMALRAQIAQSA